MAADYYWIRFLQDTPLRPADEATGRHLQAELLSAERLDPSFRALYVHGPALLSVLGNRHCAALHVCERGMSRFPSEWRLPFEAGYVCFVELGDYACAARNMGRAASLPGSPPWLPGLVARIMAQTDQRQAAVDYLTEQMKNPSLDDRIRRRLAERLVDAHFSVAQETIERALRAWRVAHGGAMPDSIETLVRDGFLPGLTADPYGGRFELNASGGIVSSTGREGLRVFRREDQFVGDLHELFLPERVHGREWALLGKPCWIWSLTDRYSGLDGTIQALSCATRWARIPQDIVDLRVLEARVMMHHDLAGMHEARLEMLRLKPDHPPTIEELEAAAGAPATDGFGTEYELDASGEPSAGRDRQPMTAASEGGCASDCDVTPCR